MRAGNRKTPNQKYYPSNFDKQYLRAKSKKEKKSSFYGRFIKIDSNLFRSVTLGKKEAKRKEKVVLFSFWALVQISLSEMEWQR